MKKFVLVLLVSLMVSGVALAQQSGKQESSQQQGSRMQGMMEDMMKGGKEGENKDGMMRMMKMMDQCSQMMESSHPDSGPAKKDQKS